MGPSATSAPTAHFLCSILDRPYDVLIASAAAEIALNGVADFLFCGVRVPLQEVDRGHDHPRCAIAALQTVLLPKAFLDWMQLTVACQALDGRNLSAVCLDGKDRAGLDSLTVQKNRARTTLARITTDVSSGQIEHVAEIVNQQETWFDIMRIGDAIDRDRDLHLTAPFLARSPILFPMSRAGTHLPLDAGEKLFDHPLGDTTEHPLSDTSERAAQFDISLVHNFSRLVVDRA